MSKKSPTSNVRQLSEKDKGKIEGRLEEMLDDEQSATKGA